MSDTATDTHAIPQPAATLAPTDLESMGPEPFSKDVLFDILQNQRRRAALSYLRRTGGTATLSDMAEAIAAAENDVPVDALSSSQRKRVYISLYQCHLPRMATEGIVDYDKNRGVVELRSVALQFDPYLDDDVVDVRPVPVTRNLAIACGIGAAVVASIAGVPGFALVPDVVWALFSAGVLVAITVLAARRASSNA